MFYLTIFSCTCTYTVIHIVMHFYLLHYSINILFSSLKSLDLMCMKQLHHRVNIIPIIGKADTIARSELGEFKNRVSVQVGGAGGY